MMLQLSARYVICSFTDLAKIRGNSQVHFEVPVSFPGVLNICRYQVVVPQLHAKLPNIF